MLDYYDKIVVGIASSLLGGVALGVATGLAVESGLFLGALVATGFVYDAMFRNPPLPPTDPRVATAMVVWHVVLVVLAVATFVD
ncbi:hypothetical protein [Halopiger xanaduensis]|uniref:hypothetical protein n=1 Tax=Halopiger xanaduensis TaxID=387343 RepID=UPI000A010B4D|nr:hypothetical protein [Halopiger xanaduensis]